MKKIKKLLLVAFGIFLGLTFPEQINDGIVFLKGVDYAGLWGSAKAIALDVKDVAIDAYDAVLGLFSKGDEAMAQ